MEEENQPADALYADRVRRFQEFLTEYECETNYVENIKMMLQKGERRLTVILDEVREFDRQYWLGYVITMKMKMKFKI